MWGYGSHIFLNEYIRHHKCQRIMEVGVDDGENARAMVSSAIENFLPEEVEYYGFDIFRGSKYDQVRKKLEAMGCAFRLFKGDSVNTLPTVVEILPLMDVIFIDGGKSYREAKNDWQYSKILMHDGTAIFIHNYGFIGVRRVVDDINRGDYLVTIIHPPGDYSTAMIKKKAS